VLLGECKAKGKTYHYQIRDSEGECRSIEGKGRRTYPIVRSRGGGEAVGPWGNRDGGGEAVRVQQRRRRGRAGAAEAEVAPGGCGSRAPLTPGGCCSCDTGRVGGLRELGLYLFVG